MILVNKALQYGKKDFVYCRVFFPEDLFRQRQKKVCYNKTGIVIVYETSRMCYMW